MNSYSVQTNSAVGQDPQNQAHTSAVPNRPAQNDTPHLSALPQDTVTLSGAAKGQQNPATEAIATNATPNKPAPHPSQGVNQKA